MDSSSVGSLPARTLLFDQSSRLEQHKANFDALKAEYLKLQEMYDKLKQENKLQNENFAELVAKSKNIIYQVQMERDEKIRECEQLRAELLTPERVAKLKDKLATEMEQTYREHIESLEVELQIRNNDHDKLKRNYNFIKLEFENSQDINNARLKELTQEHESQILAYKQQLKDISSKLKRDIPAEIQQTRQLQRNNTQLEEHIKQLRCENKELREKLNDIEVKKDHEIRSLKQQEIQSKGIIEKLSSEKESLSGQLKRLEKDLETSGNEQMSLTEESHKLQKELIETQRKLDDTIHQFSLEKDELMMKNFNEIQSLQSERSKNLKEIEQLKLQITSLENSVKFLDSTLSDKTQELAEAKEENSRCQWEMNLLIEKEKGCWEQQVTNLQSLLMSKGQEYDRVVLDLQDKISTYETEKLSLRSECDLLKCELEQKRETLLKNVKELNELKEMKLLVSSLKNEKESLEESNVQYVEEIEKLNERIQLLDQQRKSSLSEITSLHEKHQSLIKQLKLEHEEIKSSLMSREKEMSVKITELKDKLSGLNKKNDKLKKQHQMSLDEIKNVIDVSNKKENEIRQENERLRSSIDELRKNMRKKFQNYQKQHQQFVMLLNSNPNVSQCISEIHSDITSLSDLNN